jgi:hypothetical protein
MQNQTMFASSITKLQSSTPGEGTLRSRNRAVTRDYCGSTVSAIECDCLYLPNACPEPNTLKQMERHSNLMLVVLMLATTTPSTSGDVSAEAMLKKVLLVSTLGPGWSSVTLVMEQLPLMCMWSGSACTLVLPHRHAPLPPQCCHARCRNSPL